MAILPQYLSIFPKDNANREQNKMNEFVFYAKVQIIFAFLAKLSQPFQILVVLCTFT